MKVYIKKHKVSKTLGFSYLVKSITNFAGVTNMSATHIEINVTQKHIDDASKLTRGYHNCPIALALIEKFPILKEKIVCVDYGEITVYNQDNSFWWGLKPAFGDDEKMIHFVENFDKNRQIEPISLQFSAA